ncbi:MAG: T9SS type A sorting domain-containing protein [Bacteroidota bacterium]
MKYLTLLLTCWASLFLGAQENSTFPQLPATTFQDLAVSASRMIAVGDCQQFWYSEDQAASWEIYTLDAGRVFDVYFHPTDNQQAIYVNSEGIGLFDLQQGSIIEFYPLPSDFIKMVELEGEQIFALGNQQVFVFSLADLQWQLYFNITEELAFNGVSVALSESFVNVGTLSGEVVRIDRSTLQAQVNAATSSSIREIHMLDDDYGIIASNSRVFLTEDGFQQVSETNFPIARELHLPGRDTIISTLGLRLFYSFDGGETDGNSPTSEGPLSGTVESGIVLPNNNIYVFGQGASVRLTTDFGSTWQFPASAYSRTDLEDVFRTTDGEIYVCGEYGRLLRSTNNGQSWTGIDNAALREKDLKSMAVLGPDHFLFATSAGELLRLQDGEVESIYAEAIRDLFPAQNNDFLLLHRRDFTEPTHQLLRSTDNGVTWQLALEVESNQFALRIFQADDGNLYFATEDGTIYSSADQGISWQTQPTDQDINWLYRHAGAFYAISSQAELFKSTDDGVTWESIYSAFQLENAVFVGAEEIYLTYATSGHTNLIYTPDGGANWELVYQNCLPTNDMIFTPQEDLLMVHDAGHINLYSTAITSTSEVSLDEATTTWLYPNPVVRGQPLHFAPAVQAVQVYDLQGRMILQSQSNTISTSALPLSGLYLLRLRTPAGIKTQKLIVH